MRLRITGEIGDLRLRAIARRFPSIEPVLEEDGVPVDLSLAWDLDLPALVHTLERRPDLPWLHLRWAGVPTTLLDVLRGHPTVLTNGSGAHGPAIAEYVVGMVLAHYKRLRTLHELQETRAWDETLRFTEIGERTVGIVGVGDLGGSTARLLRPFGVRLLALRRHPRPTPEFDEVYGREQLTAFLERLDVLVIAAPLTAETRGLIGADELRKLPAGAFLVNVGRGPIVDEAALAEALTSGRLAGAALDVFTTEPLPLTSPLWNCPTLTISPHCADHTDRTLERALDIYLDNLGRFLAGEPLLNVVDRQLGY